MFLTENWSGSHAGHQQSSQRLPRLLVSGRGHVPTDLRHHVSVHGPLPEGLGPDKLIDLVAAAGLTGRGGAAFPTHRKLRAVVNASRPGRRPVVVGNGAEGEPASAKDKTLLYHAPHLVFDGLRLAAEAVGARRVYLYTARHITTRGVLATALEARRAARLDRVPVELVDAPHRFIAGQESALASRVSGGEALPRFSPPAVYERGVAGAPTLVLNVETLAHIALIARHGARWFRSVGTPDEPGSALVTRHVPRQQAHVIETAIGTPLGDLLPLDAVGTRAVLVGGYHGTWLSRTSAARLTFSDSSLRTAGATRGAGALAALPSDRCGLIETARVVRYLAVESAGQCGPCFNGLPRIATALAELAGPSAHPDTYRHVLRWAGLVEGRGACHHPDGTTRLVRSALAVFADELELHRRRRCSATTTRAFLPVPEGTPGRDDWS